MSANKKQVGGGHYKDKAIQPWDYIVGNKLGYLEGCAVKYISRWRDKGGVDDLRKAVHFLEKLIETETPVKDPDRASHWRLVTNVGDTYDTEERYTAEEVDKFAPEIMPVVRLD